MCFKSRISIGIYPGEKEEEQEQEDSIIIRKSLHSRKSFVPTEPSIFRMPSRHYCLKMNTLHCRNWSPELVNCSRWEQYSMQSQMQYPKLWVSQNCSKTNMHHIYSEIRHFWDTQNLGYCIWDCMLYCSSWLHITNFGTQCQKWNPFIFKQFYLKGILKIEVSVGTKQIFGEITK